MPLIKKIKNWFYPPINYAITKYYPKEALELFFLKGFTYGQDNCPVCNKLNQKKWRELEEIEKWRELEEIEELFDSYYKYINKKHQK